MHQQQTNFEKSMTMRNFCFCYLIKLVYFQSFKDLQYFNLDIFKVMLHRFDLCVKGWVLTTIGEVISLQSRWVMILCFSNVGDFYPFPHIDTFWRLCSRRHFEKHCDKRIIYSKTSNFSIFHNVFTFLQY